MLNDFNREALRIAIETNLPTARIVKALDELIEMRGKPKRLRMDNGPEFVSRLLTEWAKRRGIVLQFIQPGKPTQNVFIARFNRTYRAEILDCYVF